MLFAIPYVWFRTKPRKPPDKLVHWNAIVNSAIHFVEDNLFYFIGVDVDISYSYQLAKLVLFDYMTDYCPTWMTFWITEPFEEPEGNIGATIFNDEKEIKVYEVNSPDFKQFKYGKSLVSQVVISLTTKSKKNSIDDTLNLDSDSYNFAIDTCTSEGICKHEELFIGKIRNVHGLNVKGVGGEIAVHGVGTIKIRITDDAGSKHDLIIHNVLYVPESPANLLSPQRWSKMSANPMGTGEITVADTTLLFWDDRKYSKVVPHHPELGIPIMSVNDGYTKTAAYFNTELCKPCMPVCMHTSQTIEDPNAPNVTHIIPLDDEDEQSFSRLPQSTPVLVDELEALNKPNVIEDDLQDSNDEESIVFDVSDEDSIGNFTIDDDENSINLSDTEDLDLTIEIPQNEIDIISDAIDEKTSKHQREMLAIHWKMKHLPFKEIVQLSKKGALPKYFQSTPFPLCPACIMGKQHRRPWRGRGKKERRSIRRAQDNYAGANTSTDQMISPFGGLIPQMKGRLMRAKYYAATVFVDHHTDYTYVHLMKDTTAESTLEAKNAYERKLLGFGHKVERYHADNGRFAEKVFVQDVKDKNQNITFCGVGSHHQNGIAERRIKTLGEDARTSLAHGAHMWPEVVNKSLWPFAYKAACRARNEFKLDENLLSPNEKISGVKLKQTVKNEHTLFCPVYTLDKKLQGGIGGIPKWDPRSSAGLYLGHSPEHASNVALVMNLQTGLVSPQYHVIFDDTFSTVEYIRSKKEPSNWEYLVKHHSEDYRMDALPKTATVEDMRQEIASVIEVPANESTLSQTPPPSEGAHNDITLNQSQTPEGEREEIRPPELPDTSELEPGIHSPEFNVESDQQEMTEAGEQLHDLEQAITESGRPKRNRKIPERYRNPAEETGTYRKALGFIVSYFAKATAAPSEYYVAFKAEMVSKIRTNQEKLMGYEMAVDLNVDGSINQMHPLSFATSKAGNEVYYFSQAMKEPDRDEFIKAMVKEVEDHTA